MVRWCLSSVPRVIPLGGTFPSVQLLFPSLLIVQRSLGYIWGVGGGAGFQKQ